MSETMKVKLASGEEVEIPREESFTPTTQFRWAVPSHLTTKPPRLQQFHQGLGNPSRWIDVPRVVVEDSE